MAQYAIPIAHRFFVHLRHATFGDLPDAFDLGAFRTSSESTPIRLDLSVAPLSPVDELQRLVEHFRNVRVDPVRTDPNLPSVVRQSLEQTRRLLSPILDEIHVLHELRDAAGDHQRDHHPHPGLSTHDLSTLLEDLQIFDNHGPSSAGWVVTYGVAHTAAMHVFHLRREVASLAPLLVASATGGAASPRHRIGGRRRRPV